jgi:hypothetical protein
MELQVFFLTVTFMLAPVSCEKFQQEYIVEKKPPLANTTSRDMAVPCWCTGKIDATLTTSVRRCNVTISGVGVFCCGSLGNSVTIGWGEGDDTVLPFPSWVSAAEFSETHVYTSPGDKAFAIQASSQILTSSCATTYKRYRRVTVKKC